MLFKSARRDSAITDDPTEFVEAVRKERGIKIKRPFTLPELRSVLDLANDEWRSMILFGLYTGQRLGDIATLRWNNLDPMEGHGVYNRTSRVQVAGLSLAVPLFEHAARNRRPAGNAAADRHRRLWVVSRA